MYRCLLIPSCMLATAILCQAAEKLTPEEAQSLATKMGKRVVMENGAFYSVYTPPPDKNRFEYLLGLLQTKQPLTPTQAYRLGNLLSHLNEEKVAKIAPYLLEVNTLLDGDANTVAFLNGANNLIERGIPENALLPESTIKSIIGMLTIQAAAHNQPAKTKGNFFYADLSNISLYEEDMRGMNISGTALATAADLRGANLSELNLTGFTPKGANLNRINLAGATGILGTDLNQISSLREANLTELDLTGFNPAGKNIRDSNFTNVKGLNPNTLIQAANLEGIVLTGTGITRVQLEALGVPKEILDTITF